MNAYLDNNIIVSIENEEIRISDLLDNIDNSITDFYYSSAHIEEAEAISADSETTRNERIKKRLETIDKITNLNYLYHSLQEKTVFKIKEISSSVLNTIRDVPFANQMIKAIINMTSEAQRKQIRDSLGLDSKRLNNYKPEEVITHLNAKLKNWEGNLSFLELIEKGISLHPQGKDFGLHNRIAGIFELLDMLGYWTDKYSDKSNYARMWDSNHTFFASFCDYFISDDKRTRNKAKIVYKIYEIHTIVISSKGE